MLNVKNKGKIQKAKPIDAEGRFGGCQWEGDWE